MPRSLLLIRRHPGVDCCGLHDTVLRLEKWRRCVENVRLLVKEVIVGRDYITIRHSIPNSERSSGGPSTIGGSGAHSAGATVGTGLLLRPWRDDTALRRARFPLQRSAVC